jgi:hypothetical protein
MKLDISSNYCRITQTVSGEGSRVTLRSYSSSVDGSYRIKRNGSVQFGRNSAATTLLAPIGIIVAASGAGSSTEVLSGWQPCLRTAPKPRDASVNTVCYGVYVGRKAREVGPAFMAHRRTAHHQRRRSLHRCVSRTDSAIPEPVTHNALLLPPTTPGTTA